MAADPQTPANQPESRTHADRYRDARDDAQTTDAPDPYWSRPSQVFPVASSADDEPSAHAASPSGAQDQSAPSGA